MATRTGLTTAITNRLADEHQQLFVAVKAEFDTDDIRIWSGNDDITIDCSQGVIVKVYKHQYTYTTTTTTIDTTTPLPIGLKLIAADQDSAFNLSMLPSDGVGKYELM